MAGTGFAWSEDLDTVIGGDRVVMLVYATPASGAVLLPVNNFALRDRATGTISALNSSVGAWRKLDRIRREPRVALAYHTRAHSDSEDPRFVLVQGRASLGPPVPDYPAKLGENWERFEPWSETPALWKRWQRVYALRMQIDVAVERVTAWPDLSCEGTPELTGAPLPTVAPASQRPPGKGTGPRLDAARAARRAARLPHALLGWVGADGYPVAAPVEVLGGDREGVELRAAPDLVPPGVRRAGLTAHWFSPGSIGQNQRKHTGWLEAPHLDEMRVPPDGSGERLLYAPHTQRNYRFPASPTLYRLFTGGATRWSMPGARRAGFLDDADV
jgi:hypothetical protein